MPTTDEMVYLIDDDGVGVTDWEADFIDRMIKQSEEIGPHAYTDGQIEKIHEIYRKRVEER